MKKISVPEEGALALLGVHDENLKSVEKWLGVSIVSRGDQLIVDGDEKQIAKLENIFNQFSELSEDGYRITAGDLRVALRLLRQDPDVSLRDFFVHAVLHPSKTKRVMPRSVHQLSYIRAIQSNDMVLGIGPAGTGKTYLAVAMAVDAFNEKKVNRIILARPAVEAGEKLGFLPGDLQEKINPYLRPLYDALYDMMDAEKVVRLIERGAIEIAPIAFMRGRTLNDSFVIMDEAQNTTSEQMKMFLTRMGFGSKAVVTGDVTQIDLPPGKVSGLVEAMDLLRNISGIEFVHFDETDVVRHPLVQSIIRAYERRKLPRRVTVGEEERTEVEA
ncbi:MAG TPA: PhoH family protein [Vicinamibacteria bacterium]|nr:PhoH family protein [Vicinamibacteria bacterium]